MLIIKGYKVKYDITEDNYKVYHDKRVLCIEYIDDIYKYTLIPELFIKESREAYRAEIVEFLGGNSYTRGSEYRASMHKVSIDSSVVLELRKGELS